jgi:hypothetical protein
MGTDCCGVVDDGRHMGAHTKMTEARAIYEQFINGRMRIVGSGADRELELCKACGAEKYDNELCPWCNLKTNALKKQEGGSHYKDMAIQPVEFITANELGFLEGNIVKYVCRHHAKNGAEDIKKAIHYCELLLQTKYGEK